MLLLLGQSVHGWMALSSCPPPQAESSLPQVWGGYMSPYLLLSLPLLGCKVPLWATLNWTRETRDILSVHLWNWIYTNKLWPKTSKCRQNASAISYRFLCSLVLKCSFMDLISTKYLLQNIKCHYIKSITNTRLYECLLSESLKREDVFCSIYCCSTHW